MTRPAFDELHANVCRAFGLPEEAPTRDEFGSSFLFKWDGVDAVVAHSPMRGADSALVVVALGPAREGMEDEAIAQLMEATFQWMTVEPPLVGARDPGTGDLCVQFAHSLADTDAHPLLARVDAVAKWAAGWDKLFASLFSRSESAAAAATHNLN